MPFRLAIFVAACLAVAGLGTVPALATPSAIDDPNVSGYLGFCDVSGQQVRSGLLAAAPYAWTTVSSVAAPAGYEKGKSSIVAFQPRNEVDPIDWSGKQLNAASTFTNARHPMASATRIDSSFSDFTGTYSPKVQGLFQVRMLFTGVGKPKYSGDYPAVLVKVKGDRWMQVGGGPVNCKAGTARSVELDTLPAARLRVKGGRPSPLTARQVKAPATDSGASGTPSNGRPANVGSGAVPGSSAATTLGGASRAANARDDAKVGSTSWLWWLGAGLVVALTAGFVLLRRTASAEE